MYLKFIIKKNEKKINPKNYILLAYYQHPLIKLRILINILNKTNSFKANPFLYLKLNQIFNQQIFLIKIK